MLLKEDACHGIASTGKGARLLAIPAMVARSFQLPFRLQVQVLPLGRQLLYDELHTAMTSGD